MLETWHSEMLESEAPAQNVQRGLGNREASAPLDTTTTTLFSNPRRYRADFVLLLNALNNGWSPSVEMQDAVMERVHEILHAHDTSPRLRTRCCWAVVKMVEVNINTASILYGDPIANRRMLTVEQRALEAALKRTTKQFRDQHAHARGDWQPNAQ